jgi:hypothetical protein
VRAEACLACHVAMVSVSVSALEHQDGLQSEWECVESVTAGTRQAQPFGPRSAPWGGCWTAVITGLPTGVRSSKRDGPTGLARNGPGCYWRAGTDALHGQWWWVCSLHRARDCGREMDDDTRGRASAHARSRFLHLLAIGAGRDRHATAWRWPLPGCGAGAAEG